MEKKCEEINEWIEEEVSKPIEEWEEKKQEKCKKRKWYDPRRWLCWIEVYFVKVLRWVVVKVGKWVVHIVCRIITSALEGLLHVFHGLVTFFRGLFTLDWRMMIDGVVEAITGFLGIAGLVLLILIFIGLGPLGLILIGLLIVLDIADFVISEINGYRLREYVKGLVQDKYGSDGETYDAIADALGLEHGAFGYRMKAKFLRGYLDSETIDPSTGEFNLIKLHDDGVDLKKICGFKHTDHVYTAGPRYMTYKKDVIIGESDIDLGFGSPAAISESELDDYINNRGNSRVKFTIYCMSPGIAKIKTDCASEKGRELGLIIKWDNDVLELKEKKHVDPYNLSTQETFLVSVVGRKTGNDALEDLCRPVAVGMMTIVDHSGYTTNLMDTECALRAHKTSGVTVVDVQPDFFRKYVLIHELGHYFGLCHVAGFDRIMVSGADGQPSFFSWDAIPNYILHNGPEFTYGEAKQAWRYIIKNFPVQCLMERYH
jgi:hypothetical protein